jgi:PiT family inorganic phosphate transporter
MDAGFALAVGLAFAFALTNGFHDASNAIAALVATRAARPLQAVALAAVFNMLGPLLLGAAVADTIGGIVTLSGSTAIEVIGAGLLAAVGWNVLTWRLGLPSSSGHALVGGLVGAGVVVGGLDAIRWGGLDGVHPVGVLGTLIALAVSPVLGVLAALLGIRALRSAGRRATRRWRAPYAAGSGRRRRRSRSVTAPTTPRSPSASWPRSCSPMGASAAWRPRPGLQSRRPPR